VPLNPSIDPHEEAIAAACPRRSANAEHRFAAEYKMLFIFRPVLLLCSTVSHIHRVQLTAFSVISRFCRYYPPLIF